MWAIKGVVDDCSVWHAVPWLYANTDYETVVAPWSSFCIDSGWASLPPPCATIDLCIVRMLETPLKAFRTALCMAHKSDQQGDTMPKGAFDALNHISLFHLLVSQLFNMDIEQFEPNVCQGGIFDEAITPKTNRRRSQLRGKNIILSETHFQPTPSTMCQVLVHLGRRWWGDKSHL